MDAVNGRGIYYSYDADCGGEPVLQNIAVLIRKGEFTAVLGANGSGKTTLARHFNALNHLQKGQLTVNELDVGDTSRHWDLRRHVGMVFQNPENQFVSLIVEEDLAFGLKNYETPELEIPQRIKNALASVSMDGYERHSLHRLSGGQKQRIALAAVLALEPDIVIFDEATSMLDPKGRSEVMGQMKKLHCEGKTIILITHDIEEAVEAENVILMNRGNILACGTPHEVLTDRALLEQAEILPPLAVQLYYDLKERGVCLAHCPLKKDELVEELCQLN